MSHATGADLPPETLSQIFNCITPTRLSLDLTERRRAKRQLIAPSLVCKHWSEPLRPILFRTLELRDIEAVRFLKSIVCSPGFTTSSLPGAIWQIFIHQEATEAKSWLHHVHGLSTRLRETRFDCTVVSPTGDPAYVPNRWAPFESIPSITPSYVRLSYLTLNGIVFTTTTELARLIDNFSTLQRCTCNKPTFLDPSPVVQSCRVRRRASMALQRCEISRCRDMAVSVQAALAADIVATARRMGVDDRAWDATLEALLALVPNTFKGAFVWLDDQDGSMFDAAHISCRSYGPYMYTGDCVQADVKVYRPSAGQDAGSSLAHVVSITLTLSFVDVEAMDTIDWDALRAVVDSPHMHYLRINHLWSRSKSFEVAKRILCSVLRRTHLTWALESGKLQFNRHNSDPATSADISSVPAKHTIDGTTITLDIAEQAEWLLLPVRQPLYPGDATREEYLQQLVVTRASGVRR
ncbi:uncharacterized protein PHACADRAFT_198923 [Phanerochaete carnosa HHB-10118-sp]|uniref:F-box domain-containing protein n=1 Tax=Phanerochaete carnosa (strain HHB-10118-sp) TaxID=650164 RepID=K5W1X0_PHACS|nr:uncharacterized protein PHACADRAFT_198923 [Phanerochaete carnosa HHB-10118-sp]EKM52874.1 hypothetical protein PHACADRAFT_198923 [Phanerochaete carnosa HHB-10118-sp]